jgi:hypothetical protein
MGLTFNNISALGPYVPNSVGIASQGSGWKFLLEGIPFLAFVVGGAFTYRRMSEERKIFYLWILVPLIGLLAEGYRVPFISHWSLILLPAIWLAVAGGAVELGRPIPSPGARKVAGLFFALLILAPQAFTAWRLERHLRATGGQGMHMATLGTKLKVLERISEAGGDPEIRSMVYPYDNLWWDDRGGWHFLVNHYRRTRWAGRGGGAKKYFYIYQEGGPCPQPYLKESLKADPSIREERIGSLTLFTGLKPIPDAGVVLGGGLEN